MTALCLGIIAAGLLPAMPAVSWEQLLLLFGLVLATLLAADRVRRPTPARSAVLMALSLLLFFMLGSLWTIGWSKRGVEAMLPVKMEGVDFWAYGQVSSLTGGTGRAQQFEFDIESSCLAVDYTVCNGREGFFDGRRILLNYYGEQKVVPARTWLLRVRLNRPHGFANPGGFDYEAWLFEKGISAKGYVRDHPGNRIIGQGFSIDTLRYRLRDQLLTLTRDMDNAPLILALSLGDRDGISAQQWDLFTRTGTNHLMVISGLHVGFAATIFYCLFSYLARLRPGLLLRLPAQSIGAVGAISGALFYAALAGFSLSTQRACLMVLVFMCGRLLARRFPPSLGYCTALTCVLLLSPTAPTGAGFWLSFGAVGALLLAFTGAVDRRGARGGKEGRSSLSRSLKWAAWGRPQLVVFAGMLVPLGFWMQQVSLLSPLANIAAIPWVSLFVVPLCLAGVLALIISDTLAYGLFFLADLLLQGLILFLECFGTGILRFAGVPVAGFVLAGLGSLLLLMPKGWPFKWLALILTLPLLLPLNRRPEPGTAEVTVLDVGQGLAVLVRTAEHVLVYDTGPRFSDSFDTGRAVLYPVLSRKGIRRIDTVIISHGDNDHAGGLQSVLELMPVEALYSSGGSAGLPGRFAQTAPASPVPVPCRQGLSWRWEGVDFDLLHPEPGSDGRWSSNDGSCVLRIQAGIHSLLLPGDIEKRVERRLLIEDAARLESTVIVAPHHGSNTSSTAGFIAAADPEIVIFSAGYRSQFGHPAEAVRNRYEQAGAKGYNTAHAGALTVILGGESLEIRAHRATDGR